MTPAEQARKFKANTKLGPKGCWLWLGSRRRGKFKYGTLRVGSKPIDAHRRAWQLFRGEIPASLCVLHKCDNPPCVNPRHLFLGTHLDNARDRQAKGRRPARLCARRNVPQGENNPRAKLTEIGVMAIRSAYAHGDISQAELARLHNVSANTIGHIVRGTRWT